MKPGSTTHTMAHHVHRRRARSVFLQDLFQIASHCHLVGQSQQGVDWRSFRKGHTGNETKERVSTGRD